MNDERSTESMDKTVTRNDYASKNQYCVSDKLTINTDRLQKAQAPALKA